MVSFLGSPMKFLNLSATNQFKSILSKHLNQLYMIACTSARPTDHAMMLRMKTLLVSSTRKYNTGKFTSSNLSRVTFAEHLSFPDPVKRLPHHQRKPKTSPSMI